MIEAPAGEIRRSTGAARGYNLLMMFRFAPARALLFSVLVAGCGDAADDGGFRGEPLDELTLAVSVAATDVQLEGRAPRVSLVWLVDDLGATLEVEAAGVALGATLPTSATLQLLEVPPEAAMRADDTVTGRFALGQPIVYDDADGDARWDTKAEDVLGVASDLIVLYAPEGASGKTVGDHAPGWHHLRPAACPEALRFAGAQTGAGTLVLSGKPDAFFVLTCGEPEPSLCSPLQTTRWYCRLQPDNVFCDDCAAAVFPAGADAAACASWQAGCEAAFPAEAEQCRAEGAICVAGEPACDEPCLCQHLHDDCLGYADAETCAAKYTWCLGDGG